MKKRRLVKMIACVIATTLTMGSLMGCSGKDGEDKVTLNVPEGAPTYEDDEYIELTAFMGPPKSSKRAWGEYFDGHPDDPEEAWESFITEENFQDYKDAGFTFLLSEMQATYSTDFEGSELQKSMEIADKLDIPMVVYSGALGAMALNEDPRLSEDAKTLVDKMLSDLSQYKSFKGITLRDEPSVQHAKTFGNILDYVWSKNPDLYYYNCMLPIYGKVTSFSTGAGSDKQAAYKEYVQAIAEATGSFSYDHYPLYVDPIQNVTSVKSDYYLNYELVAEVAKEQKINAGIVVQSSSWGGYGAENSQSHPRKTNTKADIAFQVYSGLAYGMKDIAYYTYWEHMAQTPSSYVYDAMVMYPDAPGQKPIKTETYYAVQAMNEELKKFDHVFMKFDWEGSMAVAPEGEEKSALLLCVKDYKSPRIKEVTATEEALIGCQKDKNGYDGFFIVNATDPGKKLSNSVTVTFREATSAICYIEGEETKIDLKDGKYTFDLKEGEGVFVIPVK